MFPDSGGVAFTGTLHVRGRSSRYETAQECLSPAPWKQGDGRDQAPPCLRHLTPSTPYPTGSECLTGSTSKKITFLLINISVYGNEGESLRVWSDRLFSG